ncbi:hypothetical protein PUN28_009645 [Cardiocondyla obscurior]|uniref:Uncharacterized protein n=1 Tax=Cardiocondyla obscurior TaxID=286306 RepID=A0AAW2FZ76_9HYME
MECDKKRTPGWVPKNPKKSASSAFEEILNLKRAKLYSDLSEASRLRTSVSQPFYDYAEQRVEVRVRGHVIRRVVVMPHVRQVLCRRGEPVSLLRFVLIRLRKREREREIQSTESNDLVRTVHVSSRNHSGCLTTGHWVPRAAVTIVGEGQIVAWCSINKDGSTNCINSSDSNCSNSNSSSSSSSNNSVINKVIVFCGNSGNDNGSSNNSTDKLVNNSNVNNNINITIEVVEILDSVIAAVIIVLVNMV